MVRVAADIKEALDKVKASGEMWLNGEIPQTASGQPLDETATASEPTVTVHLFERKEETRMHEEL